jgi:glutaredoxin
MPIIDPIPTLYGTTWCGSSRRARALFDQHQVPYLWVNIDEDEAGAKSVEEITGGYRSVPTIVWSDGSVLVEPSMDELAKKLGIKFP